MPHIRQVARRLVSSGSFQNPRTGVLTMPRSRGIRLMISLSVLTLAAVVLAQHDQLKKAYAQTVYTHSFCPPAPGLGCYYCPPGGPTNPNPKPTGSGCGTPMPVGFRQNICAGHSNPSSLCTQDQFSCGIYWTCSTPPQQVGTCTTLLICK